MVGNGCSAPKPPRGWELPDPPTGRGASTCTSRTAGLTPLVRTRAAQFWQANDATLTDALDLALLLDAVGCLGQTPHAPPPPHGRSGAVLIWSDCPGRARSRQLARTDPRPDVAGAASWRHTVTRTAGAQRDQEHLEKHCAHLLTGLVLGCLLTDAVSDVAEIDLIQAGRGRG